MLDPIINLVQNGYNNTFGEMNGKEVLWTIIGLLCLYQLVMIKRLIDQNRRNNVPNSYPPGLQRRLTPMRRSGSSQVDRKWLNNDTPFSANPDEDPPMPTRHNDGTIQELGKVSLVGSSQTGTQDFSAKFPPRLSDSELLDLVSQEPTTPGSS